MNAIQETDAVRNTIVQTDPPLDLVSGRMSWQLDDICYLGKHGLDTVGVHRLTVPAGQVIRLSEKGAK